MKQKQLLLLILFFFSQQLLEAQTAGQIDFNDLDKYVEKARKQWNIPGLAIAIVHDNKLVFSKGYGLRNIEKKDKVDPNTLFAIASNTKAFTSAALSILVAEGKISWDDKVIKYLPYFQLYDPFVSNEMRIRDLLCHRTGLKTFSGDLLWYGSTYSRKEVIERAHFLQPAYSFRSHYGYSNIMFLAAGEIIPAVTGKSWDDFVKEYFFVPLGMQTSNTSITKFKEKTNLAIPHHVSLDKKTITIPYINWDNIAPAGSINSSVSELSNWMIMQLNDGKFEGKQILDPKQIWEMRTAHTPSPISKGAASLWSEKHFNAYGLGWDLFDYHGNKIVNHGGGADGMISKVVLIPEQKLGFVILTNSINYLPSALMYEILDRYFGKESKDWSSTYYKFYERNHNQAKADKINIDKSRITDTKPSLDLSEYVGTYSGDLYGDATVSIKANELVVSLFATPMFVGDLSHWHFNTFRIKLRKIVNLPEGFVSFILNENAKVVEMKIDIPNPDFDFTELKFIKQK